MRCDLMTIITSQNFTFKASKNLPKTPQPHPGSLEFCLVCRVECCDVIEGEKHILENPTSLKFWLILVPEFGIILDNLGVAPQFVEMITFDLGVGHFFFQSMDV